jgi:hypothetical protein
LLQFKIDKKYSYNGKRVQKDRIIILKDGTESKQQMLTEEKEDEISVRFNNSLQNP